MSWISPLPSVLSETVLVLTICNPLMRVLGDLLHWMPQDGLELGRVGPARVAHVDLVMLAAPPDEVPISVLQRKGTHAFHGGRLVRVRTHVHDLHAAALLEVSQPQPG